MGNEKLIILQTTRFSNIFYSTSGKHTQKSKRKRTHIIKYELEAVEK
jgi:hypothetical protein